MLRGIQLAIAGTAIAVAVLAAVTMGQDPEAGVTLDDSGLKVGHVLPGSPVWRDGVRAGQSVRVLIPGDHAGGWRLETVGIDEARISEAATHQLIHFGHLPWALTGLAVAGVATLVAFRAPPAGATVLPISLAFVAQPLFFAGSVPGLVLGGLAVFAAGGLAVVAYTRQTRLTVLVALVGVTLALLWVVAIFGVPALFDALDLLRWPVASANALIGLALVADVRRLRSEMLGGHGPAYLDLLYVGAMAALIISAGIVMDVPAPALLGAGVLALVVYPFWRRSLLDAFDRLVVAGARRDAAIRAVEVERGRLARDIHDAPLQDLAAVIHRLERVPEASDAATTLRGVAVQLREVATALHPPVLHDLGLAAALQDAAATVEGREGTLAISVEIDDLTREGRPPEAVEIAAYRVVQEAIGNASKHSRGSTIRVNGVVTPDAVTIEVQDDGRGFDRHDVRAAQHRGHFGLDSMRERAEAVGAMVSTSTNDQGTAVRFDWEHR